MAVQIGVYFTYEEVNGSRSTIEEFRTKLSELSRDSVVYMCSAINCVLHKSGNPDIETHDRLLGEAFPTSVLNLFRELRRNSDAPRLAFHRRQLLYTIKEAILRCPVIGRDARTMPYWGGLGRVLLMASDHLHFGLPVGFYSENDVLTSMAEMVSTAEYSGRESTVLTGIARSTLLLSTIAERLRSRPEYVDVATLFEKGSGIPLQLYQTLAMAVLSKYLTLDWERFSHDPNAFFVGEEWFKTADFQHLAEALKFLDGVSSSIEDLKNEITARNLGRDDYTAMRSRPLLLNAGRKYPFDTVFLIDKLEMGPFWIASRTTSGKDTDRLHSFWGLLFEEYINWLLESSISPATNELHPSPSFSTGEQICDSLIVCGESLVLIESKGGIFRGSAKYAGDPCTLHEEIDKQFVGTDRKRKGASQLAHSIRRLFEKTSHENIPDVDMSRIRKIFPLLVIRDDIADAPLLSHYLYLKFRQLAPRKNIRPRIVTPLFCMSASDFELISAYLSDVALSDLLEIKYRRDPQMLAPFGVHDGDIVDRYGVRRNGALEKTFASVMDEMKRQFFPNAPAFPDAIASRG